MTSILQLLAGTWFVVSSSFPMWLKGDKTEPQFHYQLDERNGKPVLDDRVTYLKKGKQKTIHGYDKLVSDRKFRWRGYGLLSIARSDWEVRIIDSEGQWAVIYFSKTLFTPAGVDIISRQNTLSDETLREIESLMRRDSLLVNEIPKIRKL